MGPRYVIRYAITFNRDQDHLGVAAEDSLEVYLHGVAAEDSLEAPTKKELVGPSGLLPAEGAQAKFLAGGRGISGLAAAKAAPQRRSSPQPSGPESSEITQLATAAVQDEWCQLLIVREQVARRQRLLTSWEHRRALASDKERCMQCDVGLLGLQTALTALHQIGLLLLDPAETPAVKSQMFFVSVYIRKHNNLIRRSYVKHLNAFSSKATLAKAARILRKPVSHKYVCRRPSSSTRSCVMKKNPSSVKKAHLKSKSKVMKK
ncbi:unnamed protein product [Symbiodinium microadriaticum]|nr:unnamed protein product [Symbiodinium microadriaticum]